MNMSTKTIRLNTSLTFDAEKEADIVEFIEKLNSGHKTGQFISTLFRIAVDCPEILNKSNNSYALSTAVNQMNYSGLSAIRKKFVSEIVRQIDDMKAKVDSIYEKSVHIYMLGKMGKQLELDNKNDNILAAQFILERQLKELQDTLGVTLKDNVYASNKLQNTKDVGDAAFEYIIESYYNIVNEMKSNIMASKSLVLSSIGDAPANNATTETIKNDTSVGENKTEENKTDESIVDFGDNSTDDDNEFVEFGDEGLSDLSNFFGA